MENRTNRTAGVAVVTGLVALLLGLCMGAFMGGIGGYLIGRQSDERAMFETPNRSLRVPEEAVPVEPFFETSNGVLVQDVTTGSPADMAGVRPGDIITALDGLRLDANHQLADLLTQYRPGEQVDLTLLREGRTETVTVTLGERVDNQQRAYLGIRYVDLSEGGPLPEATP